MLTMGFLSSSCAVSPQMEPKLRFWFCKLSTDWLERPLLADTGTDGGKLGTSTSLTIKAPT